MHVARGRINFAFIVICGLLMVGMRTCPHKSQKRIMINANLITKKKEFINIFSSKKFETSKTKNAFL